MILIRCITTTFLIVVSCICAFFLGGNEARSKREKHFRLEGGTLSKFTHKRPSKLLSASAMIPQVFESLTSLNYTRQGSRDHVTETERLESGWICLCSSDLNCSDTGNCGHQFIAIFEDDENCRISYCFPAPFPIYCEQSTGRLAEGLNEINVDGVNAPLCLLNLRQLEEFLGTPSPELEMLSATKAKNEKRDTPIIQLSIYQPELHQLSPPVSSSMTPETRRSPATVIALDRSRKPPQQRNAKASPSHKIRNDKQKSLPFLLSDRVKRTRKSKKVKLAAVPPSKMTKMLSDRQRREMHIMMARYRHESRSSIITTTPKPTTTVSPRRTSKGHGGWSSHGDATVKTTPVTLFLNVSFTGYWERKEPRTTVAPRVKNPLGMTPEDEEFVYGKDKKGKDNDKNKGSKGDKQYDGKGENHKFPGGWTSTDC